MTQQNGNPTTAQGLIDQLFGIATELRDNPLVSQAEVTVVQLLRPNPSRIGFTFINLGANPVYLWSDPLVSATRGVRLGANGGSVATKYDDDFSRVTFGWWIIATGGVSAVALQEVLIRG